MGAERDADRLRRLALLAGRLRSSSSIGALLATAADAVRVECGFGRAVVLGHTAGRLSGEQSDPLTDEASDRLRRRAMARPIEGAGHAAVASALELEDPVVAPIRAEAAVIAVLVADRPREPLVEMDRAVVEVAAIVIGTALHEAVLRARITELARELRYLTVSVDALAAEALEPPVALPTAGRVPAFRSFDGPEPSGSSEALAVLSPREVEVAQLVARGLNNREVAEELHLSVETVKDNVSRIVRKLGATNRVEAALRFVGLTHPGGPA